ncbi:MAG: hypothetical protein ACI4QL_00380 [Candidatus Fimimonas sp.]
MILAFNVATPRFSTPVHYTRYCQILQTISPILFCGCSRSFSFSQALKILPPFFAKKTFSRGVSFGPKALFAHSCARRHTFAQKYKKKQKATNINKILFNATNIFVQKCCVLSKIVV